MSRLREEQKTAMSRLREEQMAGFHVWQFAPRGLAFWDMVTCG